MVRQAGRNRRPFQIAEIATAPLRTRITELELQLADRDREVERLNDFLADQHAGCNRRREELEKQVESLRKDNDRVRESAERFRHSMQQHHVADAFWKSWKLNGEPHKHGFYESTWMAFYAALDAARGEGEP